MHLDRHEHIYLFIDSFFIYRATVQLYFSGMLSVHSVSLYITSVFLVSYGCHQVSNGDRVLLSTLCTDHDI